MIDRNEEARRKIPTKLFTVSTCSEVSTYQQYNNKHEFPVSQDVYLLQAMNIYQYFFLAIVLSRILNNSLRNQTIIKNTIQIHDDLKYSDL